MPKKTIPRLMVFFDTSALYTQVASDLVRPDVREIIEENSTHVDLQVSWHLPEVVVEERRYQMLAKARELLPNLAKLEKLLGHSFAVGEDTLGLHVDDAIQKSVKKLNIKVKSSDVDKIDWPDIISRSTSRKPPFEPGEKEKGFRDSIIAQSFLQASEANPSTPSVCRLAFVTSDQRLTEYIDEKIGGAKNIRLLKSIDELESLINTLVSNVSEEFAAELTKKASKLFFVKDDEKCLYYKERIQERTHEDHADVLEDAKIEGCLQKRGTWWISDPIFVKKERQRVHWISMVEPEFELYHFEEKDSHPDPRSSLAELTDSPDSTPLSRLAAATALSFQSSYRYKQGLLGDKKVVDYRGRDKFEVHWSASVSQAKNLTRPTIDEIKYAGHSIEDDS